MDAHLQSPLNFMKIRGIRPELFDDEGEKNLHYGL